MILWVLVNLKILILMFFWVINRLLGSNNKTKDLFRLTDPLDGLGSLGYKKTKQSLMKYTGHPMEFYMHHPVTMFYNVYVLLYIILQHSTMMSRLLAPLLLFYSFCPPYQIWCWSWPLKTGSLTWKIVFTASLSTSTNTLSTYGGNFSVTHTNATWKAIFWRPFFIRQNAPSFSHVA